jgi:hypothetical protein
LLTISVFLGEHEENRPTTSNTGSSFFKQIVLLSTYEKKRAVVFPILVTKRLILRRLDDADYPEIFLLRTDEIIGKYIQREKTTSHLEAKHL